MNASDRGRTMTPTRRAVALAGAATLAFSLVISIAPALAGNGNGNSNSGTIKIHDASNGQEAAEQDNEPWVCSFWVGFYTSGSFESGTWELLDWPPTGNGSLVASGTYDTTGDGVDTTGTLSPAAGHYRFNWQVSGDANAKHKTLWVDTDCGSQTDPDDSSPSQAESPSQESSPSQAESPSQAAAPSGDPGLSPVEQEVEHGNPGSSTGSQAGQQPGVGGDEPTLPDTAVPVGESGVLATIGLLLIIAAHAGTRRERDLPAA